MDYDTMTAVIQNYAERKFPRGCEFFHDDGRLSAGGQLVASVIMQDEIHGKQTSPCHGCNAACAVKGQPAAQEQAKEQIIKLCVGNPGALRVCMELYQGFGEIPLLKLAEFGIEGPDIWLLYKDECRCDTAATQKALENGTAVDLLRANPYSSFKEA